MEIAKFDKSHEDSFFAYIKGKEHEFFFLVMDYKLNSDQNHLYVAIDKNQEIQGIFQILYGQIQARGSFEAIQTFLTYLKDKNIEIRELTAPLIHNNSISQFFESLSTNRTTKIQKYRMILSKGMENLNVEFECQNMKGTKENKEKLAALIRKADPKHWGDIQSNHIIIDLHHPYFVIKENKQNIICLSGLWFDEEMGLINVIATHPDYRKKGYATSILSTSVDWLLKRSKKILIDVRTDNYQAIRIYQKTGFEIAFEYIVYSVDENE